MPTSGPDGATFALALRNGLDFDYPGDSCVGTVRVGIGYADPRYSQHTNPPCELPVRLIEVLNQRKDGSGLVIADIATSVAAFASRT